MAITAEAIKRLKAQLLTSGVRQRDQALFQVVDQLIDAVTQSITGVQALTGGGGGGGGGILAQSFATVNNDQGTLPNSRQIWPGQGIQFNDQGQKLIINAALPYMIGEEPEYEAYIPLPGPQGPTGIPGSSSIVSAGLMPLDYCCEYIEPILVSLINPGWIDIPHNSGDFTGSGTITWTVAATDLLTFSYVFLNERTVGLNLQINLSSLSGAGNTLTVALPARITPKKAVNGPALIIDAGVINPGGFFATSAGVASISFLRSDFGNFTPSTDTTGVFISTVYEV